MVKFDFTVWVAIIASIISIIVCIGCGIAIHRMRKIYTIAIKMVEESIIRQITLVSQRDRQAELANLFGEVLKDMAYPKTRLEVDWKLASVRRVCQAIHKSSTAAFYDDNLYKWASEVLRNSSPDSWQEVLDMIMDQTNQFELVTDPDTRKELIRLVRHLAEWEKTRTDQEENWKYCYDDFKLLISKMGDSFLPVVDVRNIEKSKNEYTEQF